MSITPPVLNPLTLGNYPVGYERVSDIAPFTYRSGATYQSLLEAIRAYLPEKLVPWIEENFDAVSDSFEQIGQAVQENIADALKNIANSNIDTGLVILVDDAGATDYTLAIQSALDSGKDVYVVGSGGNPGRARVKSTLTMNVNAIGQRFETRHASICPDFIGDTVQVTTYSFASLSISGELQPGTGGDEVNAAGIRIGTRPNTTPHYNPQQASVANSIVRGFRGSGIVWDDGAMIDFTHVAVYGATQHGISARADVNDATNSGDNNHGWFANTHMVNCGQVGYRIDGDGSNLNNGGSRHHVFQDAKAFGCQMNFYIASRSNSGTVFSELSVQPSTFDTKSRGNKIDVLETAASFEGWIDNGIGNVLSGFSGNNIWETKYQMIRVLEFGSNGKATTFDQAISGILAVNQAIGAGAVVTASTGRQLGGNNFTCEFASFIADGAGYIICPTFGADGTLSFNILNMGGARTFNGNINYVVKRFVS